MAVTTKNAVFLDVMLRSSLRADVSEERIASIIEMYQRARNNVNSDY
jgi:hypothetical protein